MKKEESRETRQRGGENTVFSVSKIAFDFNVLKELDTGEDPSSHQAHSITATPGAGRNPVF